MTLLTPIDILSRWLHVITACVLTGCAFFAIFLLPVALLGLEAELRAVAKLRVRRPFKIIVHASVAFLLLSGAYNAVRNWHLYNQWPGVTHGIFGVHLLLGLAVMTMLLIALAGKAPKPSSPSLMQWALILAFLAVLAASTLKWAREYGHDHPKTSFQHPNLARLAPPRSGRPAGALSCDSEECPCGATATRGERDDLVQPALVTLAEHSHVA
jgi:uncharacterized membrane protein